jgi:hypothetical protein
MPDHDDPIGGLPDVIRDSNRPIIIYQGVAPGQIDPVTSNALGLLAWLSILTICLICIGLSFWSIWNPSYDPARYSPIHAEGQPRGLANSVSERREINARTAGLLQYLERIQADNFDRRRTNETHALVEGPSGIDALRRDWDAACRAVRARVYDRRIGDLETRLSDFRRRLRQTQDAAQRTELNASIADLVQQRRTETERRRTDSDPTLRCTPAAEAPVCSRTSEEPWCNPELSRPDEFTERRST